ncbi:MAG: CDP-glycerol glycerophosphotransferase family protein [Lachnospiraceae bacterium]|nr:CDP-glycerol glycerophosphotransferase family protein [Lachnospiraceae bacterium]
MFWIKQWMKMLLQNVLLPLIYRLYCRRPVESGLVLFADAHHDAIPFSMRRMYETVQGMAADAYTPGKCPKMSGSSASGRGREAFPDGDRQMRENAEAAVRAKIRVETFVTDFDRLSFPAMAKYLLRFMRRYAAAEYVFICDYFLPVSSCRKRPETKVVQLWHSCGLMKKIAYDTGEDIPKGYHGSMFDNYSYLTLSAESCIPVHERALRLPREHIFATGISRTDDYFDESWNARCRESFYKKHPQAAGRRVAVWAPTFRGNAARPRLEGLEAIRQIAEETKDEWFFIIKAHPHIDRHERISNSEIPTEELFPVADVLITDYSSVLFDYLLYRKPLVLFAPDLEEYERTRGFYIDYRSMPFPCARTREELGAALKYVGPGKSVMPGQTACLAAKAPGEQAAEGDRENGEAAGETDAIDAFREKYVGACDGYATERILRLTGML